MVATKPQASKAGKLLVSRRKSHGPEPVRRWRCEACGEEMGTNEMRSHTGCEVYTFGVMCLRCGDGMTKSQTRTHRCEEGK